MSARPRRRWKRAFDVVASASALVVLSPVIGVTALLVRTKLGSPVLFRQERPGLDGAPFLMMKFRSMLDAYDEHGEPLPDEDRITAFGTALRKTSLDELPELINVLTGDMSIVGPRPLLMQYLPLYNEFQYRRHEVRPGVTGLAQVSGRNDCTWDEKFAYDVEYVDNCSPLLDLRIIARTIKEVLTGSGVDADGVAVGTEYFLGSPEPDRSQPDAAQPDCSEPDTANTI